MQGKGAKIYSVPEIDGYDYSQGPKQVRLEKFKPEEEKSKKTRTGVASDKNGVVVLRDEWDTRRILPVSTGKGKSCPPPSELSEMVDGTSFLSEGCYMTFAQVELKRLMDEGKITNRPYLGVIGGSKRGDGVGVGKREEVREGLGRVRGANGARSERCEE